jgi:carbon storage regulator
MLVLSRRVGERIFLPDLGVHVTVLSVKSGAVRVGIEAPEEVLILRDELRHRAASKHSIAAGASSNM